MRTTDQMRLAMVEQMVAAGVLRSASLIDAFQHVPRHVFLRRFFRQSSDLSGWEAVCVEDPGALELIYSTTSWVTQIDHDPRRWETARAAGKPVPGTPTSSSTTPNLMALMLEALDIQNGHRVLEIGTGTGYHAAVLCHRLASALVTTVEVDPVVTQAAREALHTCGFALTVVTGDGGDGYAASAPYDRLIATYSTPDVPRAWVEQVRPGGLILTSLHRGLGAGPLIRLRVDEHGEAAGRFLADYGGFMPTRTEPTSDPTHLLREALRQDADEPYRPTSLREDVLEHLDFGMVAALALRGVTSIGFQPAGGDYGLWLFSDDGSWAHLDTGAAAVAQRGARRLWDELESLHRSWRVAGCPGRDRYGLTVTGTGQHLFWLDTPDRVLGAADRARSVAGSRLA